jgi:glycosyltransferase involved in cell wall biosynthesis
LSENKKQFSLTTIVPAFNEGETIGITLSQLLQALEKQPLSYEIIVVDDGSRDGTGIIAKEKGANVVIRNFNNVGKGAAIASGVAAASGSIIVLMDADGTYDPRDIPNLISPILRGEADLVIGSRYSTESASLFRFLINRLFLFASKILLGIGTTGVWSGFRAYKADEFKGLIRDCFATSGFEFDLETLYFAQKKGYRIVEMPFRTRLRKSVGYSKPKSMSQLLNFYRFLLQTALLRREEE